MSKTYLSAALRRLVYERANQACEYCLIPEVVAFISHEVDHIIAEKHGGKTEESNLALACAICNKNKGSDVASVAPQTQQIIACIIPVVIDGVTIFSLMMDKLFPSPLLEG